MDDKIKLILSSVFKISVDSISEETSMSSVKSWDSINQMKLIVALEEEFGVEFEDDQILQLSSFNAIKDIISKF